MADPLSQDVPVDRPVASRASAWPSWLLLSATLLAGVVYVFVLDVPLLRETGLPTSALMPLFALAAVWRLRARRSIGTILPAFLAVGLTTLFFVGVFAIRLPDAQAGAQRGAVAADFTLPDQAGAAVTLSDAWRQGPLLLVFYRGHW